MSSALASLPQADRDAVLDAVVALENADEPIRGRRLAALDDAALRGVVEDCLGAAGRVLVEVSPGFFLSGYDDTIADRLIEEGLGVLPPVDRAVLALVLLRTVAIPRAAGEITGTTWMDAKPCSIDDLAQNRTITKEAVKHSVRRLRIAGILPPGNRPDIRPGPQFQRLTLARSARIWEELLLVCQPEGVTAESIRRRRRMPERRVQP
jgi:hypothetical protein